MKQKTIITNKISLNNVQLKNFFHGILVLLIIVLGTSFLPKISHASVVEIPDSSELFDNSTKEKFENGDSINLAETSNIIDYTYGEENEEGEVLFRKAVMKLLEFFKKVMGPIAIILLVYGGVELYLSHGNEEKYKQTIGQIAGIGTGFLLMLVAVNIVDWVFFGQSGEIFRGEVDPIEFAKRGMVEITGLFDYMTIFVVIIAVAFIVWNAFTLIIAGGEDEAQISNIKKRILFSIIGIIILISAKPMIEIITSSDGGLIMPSVLGAISIVARWINFILGLIGILAVIAIIYAGIRLILHFGDEEATTQAKNIVMGAIIGLIITFSSWTIINYFIAP